MDPCGRGSVREHRREWTRTDGTEPARYPPPEMVRASAGRDGAVRPPWIPRNRRPAALAGAWRRSAATSEADASISPTDCWDETRRLNIARRFGSAMISNTDSISCVYSTAHIRVKVYLGRRLRQQWPKWISIASSRLCVTSGRLLRPDTL